MEFVSVRKGNPCDNLTHVAVVYSKEGWVPRLDGRLDALALNKVIYSSMARTEYKTIAVGKMKKWICLSSHHLTQDRRGLSLSALVSDPAASHPPAEREDVHRSSVRRRRGSTSQSVVPAILSDQAQAR